ncbi:MAG: class I tRNA ligase family protein, partial [Candidatus Micrarchaeota archaeon]
IPYKFGFLLFQGKKYSKSKGIGMGVSDLMRLVPPDIIKYFLLKPDVQENKDFDPTGNNMLRLYDDYQGAAELQTMKIEDLSRADRKRAIAYKFSTSKLKFKAKFIDVLLNYQLYKDWNKVAELVSDKNGVSYLSIFISTWLEMKYAPEEYQFEFKPSPPPNHREAVIAFANSLKAGLTPEEIHNQVFITAKETNIQPSEMFSALYGTLISKERGPRLGKLVFSIGVERTKKTILQTTQ